jgi:hypothetical protein
VSTDTSELRPPKPNDEGQAEGSRSLLADVRAAVASDEVALRVFVTACVTLAVGWLGIKEAVGGVIASQVLTEAIKSFVRRRRWKPRTIWLITLLLFLLELAQRALAAVRKILRLRKPTRGVSAVGWRFGLITSTVVAAVTVFAITVPELALGHALVGDGRTTFFGANGHATALRLPGQVHVEASGANGARVVYQVDSDRGDVRCSQASGSIFRIGTTVVTCTAGAGEDRMSGSFRVTVEDTIAPRLTLPRPIKLVIAGSAVAVPFSASAVDIVDRSTPVRCTPASGSRFLLGTTSVHCVAVDAHHNRARGRFRVTLERAPPGTPIFSVPVEPVVVEATGPNGAVVTYDASATDASGNRLQINCSPRSGSVFALATSQVTCRATVPHGATKSAHFSVTAHDTTPPQLTLPVPLRTEATAKEGATVDFDATARDAVSGALTPSCNPISGTLLPIGEHTVRCSATDDAGHAAHGAFAVTVFDGAPIITIPADVTKPYVKPTSTPVEYVVAADDRIDGTLTPACTPESGSQFGIGTTTVECSVTDSGGNAVTESFRVTIVDTVPPVLYLPKSFTRWAPFEANTYRVSFKASARDAVDGTVKVTCTPASRSEFAVEKTTQVHCIASDRTGNIAEGEFSVTVKLSPE